MLVKIDKNTIVNLDRVIEIRKTCPVRLEFLFTLGMEDYIGNCVDFENEHLRDLALDKILSNYMYGNLVCDITEYVKKGEYE